MIKTFKTWNKWDLEAQYRLLELRAQGLKYQDIANEMGRTLDAIKGQAAIMQKVKPFDEWFEEFGIEY